MSLKYGWSLLSKLDTVSLLICWGELWLITAIQSTRYLNKTMRIVTILLHMSDVKKHVSVACEEVGAWKFATFESWGPTFRLWFLGNGPKKPECWVWFLELKGLKARRYCNHCAIQWLFWWENYITTPSVIHMVRNSSNSTKMDHFLKPEVEYGVPNFLFEF